MKFLVTGGCGYIGYHIGRSLLDKGHQVVLYDVTYPDQDWDERLLVASKCLLVEHIVTSSGLVEFVKGDVRDLDLLLQATQDVDCVIHTASFGMSGRQQLTPFHDLIEDVNVNGTRQIIEACCMNRVKGLVYTSTYNVVFGGQVIINGDESLPYFPLHRHVDYYSQTKAIAEKMVLSANGKSGLKTCALRLAGVIGPGEKRHLPRVMRAIRQNLIRFDYQDKHGALVDFVGLENVVQAHVKAALKIIEAGSTIGGSAYFISDGQPINNLQYFRPLIEHFGRSFPTRKLPMWFMTLLVFTVNFLFNLIHRWVNFTPFLTPAELYKTGVTHHFCIDKARKELDYQPVKPNDLSDVIEFLSVHEPDL